MADGIQKPTQMPMDDFIGQYVTFTQKLIEAEDKASIPEEKRANPERIAEAFRFWFVDTRDREDLIRAIAMDEREREEDREERKKNNDRFWED